MSLLTFLHSLTKTYSVILIFGLLLLLVAGFWNAS